MIKLIKMSAEEFQDYKTNLIQSYGETLAKNTRRSLEAMLIASEQQINGLLKDGVDTKDQYIFNIVDAETMEVVGVLWVQVKVQEQRSFIFDIELKESQQGKGYGKATLNALEVLMKEMDVKQIGLNVFADNPIAIKLYEKSGYEVTNMNMVKELK